MRKMAFKESLTVEFKSDRKKLPDEILVEAVVAFANTDGGEIYLGVEDGGEITGLHQDHADPLTLSAFISNRTVPPISTRTEVLEYAKPVLKISVPRSATIVATSSGKMLRRRLKADGTPENVPMYPYEITSRLSSLSLLDLSAQPLPNADYDDLDVVERERLRNSIRAYKGDQGLLSLADDELDKALRLVTTVDGKLVPTMAGLLLIGRAERIQELIPTAEASIQILEGTSVVVNESFTQPLLRAFEQINTYVAARNRETEMEMGLFRISIPDIDKRAFREALVNAFSHRDYSMLGRVIVRLEDEGLTISNPGGFIEGISIDSLLDAEPHGRNPALADALKRIGLAERTGRGIDRIFEGSLQFGRLLPDYSASNERTVKLFIPKGRPDQEFIKMVSEEQKRIGRSLPIHSLLVLNTLKQIHRATIEDISMQTNIDGTKIKVTLGNLIDSGLVEAIGTGKAKTYILSSKVYKRSDNTVGYVRAKYIDAIRFEELVLTLAREQGSVTRKDVMELLHLSSDQAYRVLRKMVDDNRLKLRGKGKNSRYVIKGT